MRKAIMFASGALAGLLVGGVAALLLAPESGESLRGKAREGMGSLLEEGKKAAMARRAELQRQLEGFKRGTGVDLGVPTESIVLE